MNHLQFVSERLLLLHTRRYVKRFLWQTAYFSGTWAEEKYPGIKRNGQQELKKHRDNG